MRLGVPHAFAEHGSISRHYYIHYFRLDEGVSDANDVFN